MARKSDRRRLNKDAVSAAPQPRTPAPVSGSLQSAPLLISLLALVISGWSVIEARESVLQLRRAEVRYVLTSFVNDAHMTLANGVCVLAVTKGFEAEANQMKTIHESAITTLEEMEKSTDMIHSASHGDLNTLESVLDKTSPIFRAAERSVAEFRTLLNDEELGRVKAACG